MASWLIQTGVIALPLRVETAAWATPLNNELRVLVNQPDHSRTVQLRVLRSRQVEELSPLPLVAAGVCACDGNLLVTGSNDEGQPVVLGVSSSGVVLWQFVMEGENRPIRWPEPGCGAPGRILWQDQRGKIEVAAVSAKGLAERHTFSVGGPPLDVAIATESLWAAWADDAGVFAAEIRGSDERLIKVDGTFSGEVAVSAQRQDAYVAWIRDSKAFWNRIGAGEDVLRPASEFDLGADAGAIVTVIPGSEPFLLARRMIELQDEPSRRKSILAAASGEPMVIESWLHSVVWWDEMVAALDTAQLRLMRKHTENGRTR